MYNIVTELVGIVYERDIHAVGRTRSWTVFAYLQRTKVNFILITLCRRVSLIMLISTLVAGLYDYMRSYQ